MFLWCYIDPHCPGPGDKATNVTCLFGNHLRQVECALCRRKHVCLGQQVQDQTMNDGNPLLSTPYMDVECPGMRPVRFIGSSIIHASSSYT